MIGWVAARGALTPEAWALFAIVFVWQIPHFMAIAWLYRDDFGRAGFPLLPVVDPDGRSTARQAVLFSLLLVPRQPRAVLPADDRPCICRRRGRPAASASLARHLVCAEAAPTIARALLFLGSITYLPLLWGMLILDRL